MNKTQEDRVRERFAEKMREKSAKARADAEARRARKPPISKAGRPDGPKS